MNKGIAAKLSITYMTIIIAIVVSGVFCLYVLSMNQATNKQITTNTLPALEELKEVRVLMIDARKLTGSWAFSNNRKDRERLLQLLNNDIPILNSSVKERGRNWGNANERRYLDEVTTNNDYITKKIRLLTTILSNDDSYLNDSTMEKAEVIDNFVTRMVNINDKLLGKLISIKKENLASQQQDMALLLKTLYFTIFFTIIVVIAVTFISLRFTKNSIVRPLTELNKIILQIAEGRVVAVSGSDRTDEIGQIQNAIVKMVEAAVEKIHFAEQIGKGNYAYDFSLLSTDDKLGAALLAMRDDLVDSNRVLVEQEQRLRDAQRIARIGNYYYDVKTRTFQSSETFDEILGIYDDKDKLVDNWIDLIAPEYKEQVYQNALNALQENHKFSEQYKLFQYKTGKEVWVEVKGENMLDKFGKATSMFGTMQDITESKTLQAELKQSYEIATEQNKRLSNFSYIVSHNLRMHAVNIHGLLNLYTEAETGEEKEEILGMLMKAAALLDETMFHLNEVVVMQNSLEIESASLDLNICIEHAINTLKVQIAQKNAVIVNNVPAGSMVNYNPSYLDSILLNLLSNAVKYSHAGRQPRITIDFTLGDKTKDNWNILQVSDNGIGIDMKLNAHKLFGMYKTFHANEDAKGLGLFMVKCQIEAMGGKIEASSEVDKGTTFKVFIK